MKKNIFIFLLLFSIVTLNIYKASAQKIEDIRPNPQTKPSINYILAYPGIMADHPLYKLKVLRDKIIEKSISDPKKKIDFYLLQTDKMILAASILAEKNKIELAKETALKGEHNYTKLVDEFRLKNKRPNNEAYQKLKKASLKHQEVLKVTINRLENKNRETFKNVLYFSEFNLSEIEKMYNNKK